MATRPAWTVKNNTVICEQYVFTWNGGFSITQKQKNIRALHQAIKDAYGQTALEVSSKSQQNIGKNIGAFSLKSNGIYLENIFQASKKYELGGPYLDLLNVTAKEAKQDERHRTSGRLIAFVKDGVEWSLYPKTAFYDYIYIHALLDTFGETLDLSSYDWFTDIEFNPQKSINCQAKSIAIYKLLQKQNILQIIEDKSNWIKFHEKYVK